MRTTMLVVVWLLALEYVTTQQLSQPAVPFTCGNIRCERQGFYACVGADIGEPACFPCKMKLGTCGTINEFSGCNLFCEDQLIKKYELRVERYKRTNLEQNDLIQKLTRDNGQLNNSIEDNNVTITQMEQRITNYNSTINEQNVTIRTLLLDNRQLNYSVEAQSEKNKELKSMVHADSKTGYSGSITELIAYLPQWFVGLMVLAVLNVPLATALVVVCIKFCQLRKTMKLKYKCKTDSEVAKPLSPSRSDSGVSLELGNVGGSTATVSSDINNTEYSHTNKAYSSINIPDSCSGTDNGKDRLQQCPPTDDQGNTQYQFSTVLGSVSGGIK